MHPTLFSAFVDIEGDFTPNAGNKAETIANLFRGNADAWAAFDPTTVINRHGRYTGRYPVGSRSRRVVGRHRVAISRWSPIPPRWSALGRGAASDVGNPTAAGCSLCALGRANGIDCAVVAQPGAHNWPTRRHSLCHGVAMAGRPAGYDAGGATDPAARAAPRFPSVPAVSAAHSGGSPG